MALVQALSGMENYQKECRPKAQGLFDEVARSERILISESRFCSSTTAFKLAYLGRQQDCPTPNASVWPNDLKRHWSHCMSTTVLAKVLIPMREESAPICRSAVAERPLSSILLQKFAFVRY